MSADRTIGPTPERLLMAGDSVEVFTPSENENWRAIRLLDKHVLEEMRSRKAISGDQYSAGMRFYGDWFLSGLANSGVIDPGRIIVDGGKMDYLNDIKMSALTRHHRAIQALGLIVSHVLTCVLLTEESLQSYGHRVCGYKNPKQAKLAASERLKQSLAALDYYYYGKRETKVRSAHAEDYRPSVMADDDAGR
jgi:hypothetical protein